MSKYINADKLIKDLRVNAAEHYNSVVNSIIIAQPSADVVEVVRCKDCKHSKYREDYDDYECEASGCGLVNNADFYCADGERKESKVKKCFDIPIEVAKRLLEDMERSETDD